MNNPIPAEAEYYLDEYDGERFWRMVNFHGGTSYATDRLATATGECWLWNSRGPLPKYGTFRLQGKMRPAHRISYMEFGNKLPKELDIDHLCRVKNCVRPSHLEAVTSAVNVKRGLLGHMTHCKQGHEFTAENTQLKESATGVHRICRACRKAWKAAAYQRAKAAAASV